MLEIVLTAAGIAFSVSAGVVFLTHWGTRIRLRRLEVQLAEWEERLVTEVKRRAAQASVEARGAKLNPLDEALIRQHMQRGGDGSAEAPWWDKIVGEGHGPPG